MAAEGAYYDNERDTFKILLATDVHLGYKHLDPVMGNDAMNTFKEILQLAHDHEVDFVLLGGDLFHQNNPPRDVLHDCFQLLKEYCVGKRGPRFQVEEADPPVEETVKWKISMPVFSIHGNHDEPTGPKGLSALDLLHSAGLLHYFGKTDSLEEIHLRPLLLRKGSTNLAMYGVGNIRSDKLQQMYRNNRVSLQRPMQNPGDWFTMFVLHQNHVKRPDNTHVEEASIHGFIDLVIWGHEHESKLRPQETQGQNGKYWLSQPGSSVATEFKKSEMVRKQVGLLTVCGKAFEVKPLPLKTVRQLYIKDHVPRVLPGQSPEKVENTLIQDCKQKVEEILREAEEHRGPQQPKEPLIRIKIQQQHHVVGCSAFRFGIPFQGRVANPDSILAFGRRMDNDDSGLSFPKNPDFPTFSIQELIRKELCDESLRLQIFPEADMFQAVKQFVEFGQNNAFQSTVKDHLTDTQTKLKDNLPTRRSEIRATPSSSASGQEPDNTEPIDTDEEFYEEIDTYSQQLLADPSFFDTSQSTSNDRRTELPANPPEHIDDNASDFFGPQAEAWLENAEDDLFSTS